MEDKKDKLEQNNPEKVYRDEFSQKGSTFTDSPIESDARDKAKMERTTSPYNSQKIDGNNPYADEDSMSDEEMNRETYDDHK
jgi:hypothetical protein